jgi:hypothetical protein
MNTMTSVQFQAQIENGTITVPEAYRQQIASGTTVNVILLQAPELSRQALSHPLQPALAESGVERPAIPDPYDPKLDL